MHRYTPTSRFLQTHTNFQKAAMASYFNFNKLPDANERESLGRALGMTKRSVQVWFQNRRQRQKDEPDATTTSREVELYSGALNGAPAARGDKAQALADALAAGTACSGKPLEATNGNGHPTLLDASAPHLMPQAQAPPKQPAQPPFLPTAWSGPAAAPSAPAAAAPVALLPASDAPAPSAAPAPLESAQPQATNHYCVLPSAEKAQLFALPGGVHLAPHVAPAAFAATAGYEARM